MSAAMTTRQRKPKDPLSIPSLVRSESSSTAPSADNSDGNSSGECSPISSASSVMSLPELKQEKIVDTLGNPFEAPTYTMKQIQEVIPKHCFKRSNVRSLGYVARDLALLSATFYLFNTYTPMVPYVAARAVLWGVYTVLQGFFATGLWVLAHECGHRGFSANRTLCDVVGWTLHSALLVPYHSWRITHGKHHKNTGNIERDMVFNPKTKEEYCKVSRLPFDSELVEETPIFTLGHLVAQQLVGWPAYILSNVTGHNCHEAAAKNGRGVGKQNGYFGGVNHFLPSSPLFEDGDYAAILWSDLGVGLTITALYFLVQKFGFWNMFVWYFIPYLWVNHWLVAITYLQHTDPTLPHYSPSAWTFPRGASATIDRDFGFIGRHLLHGIIETHVAHHFVSTIPFYHADEATRAIKTVMGQHYREDRGSFLGAMWMAGRWCNWIEEQGGSGVWFFRNRNGLGVQPAPVAKAA